jgi:transcriptional regulator NrdR family protein
VKCPECQHVTSVFETRNDDSVVHRRRICDSPSCGTKVNTIEIITKSNTSDGDVATIARRDLDQLLRLAATGLAIKSPQHRKGRAK